METNLQGAFAPLITPLTDEGSSISEVRVARLIRFLRENGVEGFALATETGEFSALTFSERKNLVEIAMRETQQSVPLIVHVTASATSSALDLAQHAERHGAKAVTLMPPHHSRFSDYELENHFKVVHHYTGLPIIVIDPRGHLGTEVREKIASFSRVKFGSSLAGSAYEELTVEHGAVRADEFHMGELVVSPLLQLPCAPDKRPLLSKALIDFGRVRTAKAALQAMDLEVGMPRGPMLPLTDEKMPVIRALF